MGEQADSVSLNIYFSWIAFKCSDIEIGMKAMAEAGLPGVQYGEWGGAGKYSHHDATGTLNTTIELLDY